MVETAVAPVAPATASPDVKAPAPAPVAGKAPVPETKPASKERMYTVTVNGKQELWPESKVLERAQKAEGAERRMAHAEKLERAFERFVAQTQDPRTFIQLLDSSDFKYDDAKQEALVTAMLESKKPHLVAAVRKWLYENEVEPKTLTEEQRKLRELEKFKSQKEREETERKTSEEQAKQKALAQQHWTAYRKQIGAGIKAEKLPETEMMVARVARKVQLMRKAGYQADVSKACQLVKSDLVNEYNLHLNTASDDEILNLLPQGIAERINQALLKRLKGGNSEPKESGAPRATKPKSDKKGPNLADQLRAVERGRKVF